MTSMKNDLLDAIAADDAPSVQTAAPVVATVARCGAATKSGAPCAFKTENGRACPVHHRAPKVDAPKIDAPKVDAPKTVSKSREINVQGYTIVLNETEHDIAQIKAAILRETSNPWYPVAILMASKKCATMRITRDEGVKGTPVARIRAAITRLNQIRTDAMMRGVAVPDFAKYATKLGIAAHASDKNCWLFVKLA